MTRRVVITGLGVIAPNGNGVPEFELALRKGKSGIAHRPEMAEAGLRCQVAGVPEGVDALSEATFETHELQAMNDVHRMGALAALEAWADAGLAAVPRSNDEPDWDTGAVIGTGIGGVRTVAERVVPLVAEGRGRRVGSRGVEQMMMSGPCARVAGLLGLGNQTTANSSACATGVEALVHGLDRIRSGRAERMLCGSVESANVFTWAAFDSMRVVTSRMNEAPERASRPMSASAAGFVPGAGAGILVLESEDSALRRGARVYGELAGGEVNCGGQRGGGSMTSPNAGAVRACIRGALADAGVTPAQVGAISGHLTATGADPSEIASWASALERTPETLPPLTATKSLVGHALGAAGAIEAVAAVLMLCGGYIHASRNCEDVHPEIEPYADAIAHETRALPGLDVLIKAGFGFGDVNAAVVFRRWEERR